jgi:homoserine O-acetyltransferase
MNYRQHISPKTQVHRLSRSFRLESGVELAGVEVAYRTWGSLNPQGDNALLLCHALTGNADADEWWASLFGVGKTLDPAVDFIVCSNFLGSCYGTTGPTSLNPHTGIPYGSSFPAITIRDMVHLQALLLEALGVQYLKFVMGGSLGGMQALEWAVLYPEQVGAISVIAAPGRHSAWCIGLSEAQRQAIYADPHWQQGNYTTQPSQGLEIARMIAMSTYRSWQSFQERFGRQHTETVPESTFAISSYLHYQGRKLVDRFDANTYVRLTQAMDSHDVGRDRGDYETVLSCIHQPTLIVSIDSDILYPPLEQQELARLIPNARLEWLRSPHGHDAFLLDIDQLNQLMKSFQHQLSHPISNVCLSNPKPSG